MTPPPPPGAPDDSIGSGAGFAVMCQVALIVAGALTLPLVDSIPFAPAFLLLGWGMLQWFVLVPLYLKQRRKGRPLAGKGILIAGCIGFLLNAACDGIISALMTYRPS